MMLFYETKLFIDDVLYSFKSKKNLLSFKNIHPNRYYIETIIDNDSDYLCITFIAH